MTGKVDSIGRALVPIAVRSTRGGLSARVDAWIDTGFNGDLVLPASKIQSLGLTPSGTAMGTLADGSEVILHRFICFVDWLDGERELEVLSNEGEVALLGVGLLVGYDLHISYRTGNISIE